MAEVKEFSDDNFNENIANGLTVVDFWAEWCGPCRMINPIIKELATEYDGKVSFGKVDVDQNAQTSQSFRIMSIPSVLLFHDGELQDKIVGAAPKGKFVKMIEAALAKLSA